MRREELVSIALSECLEALRRHGDVEECIRRYPQFEQELRELVAVARMLPNLAQEADLNAFGGWQAGDFGQTGVPPRPEQERERGERGRDHRLMWSFCAL